MSKIKNYFKRFYSLFFETAYTYLTFIPMYVWIGLQYLISTGKIIDFKNPRGFEQKMQWIKAFYRNPLYIKCSDKYTVRQYIKEKGYAYILPELINKYDRPEDINLSKLPQSFVLKLSTGSGKNYFVYDKETVDFPSIIADLNRSIKKKPKTSSGETQYLYSKPVILCEPYLAKDGMLPADYKFYCCNGEVLAINYGPIRSVDNNCKVYIVDMAFNDISSERTLNGVTFISPKHFQEMIDIAKDLSKEFPFVRVDFYENSDNFYFSELTFTPSGGTGKYLSKEANLWLGEHITLPADYYSRTGKWVY